jgi:hypothetical protein
MMPIPEQDLDSLLDSIKKDVKTDSYPMSIGEIASMYQNDELILKPVYQRYFRWDDEQKSKLIESILIGLPLPSFFVATNEKGIWEVVDGMQRLSTILDFMGMLKKASTSNEYYRRFECLSGDLFYLKKPFEGKKWEDLSRLAQLEFKRSKIQLTILQRTKNEDVKFELFQRLNSSSSPISGQELRNAILAEKNADMLEWFEKMAKNKDFVAVTGLSENDTQTRKDVELVLRFVVFLSTEIEKLKDYNSVDVFLTSAMRSLMIEGSIDTSFEEKRFNETFRIINNLWGKNGLKLHQKTPGKGKFSVALFEAVALGIAQNIDVLPNDKKIKGLKSTIAQEEVFQKASGSGKTASSRIPNLLSFGKKQFSRS